MIINHHHHITDDSITITFFFFVHTWRRFLVEYFPFLITILLIEFNSMMMINFCSHSTCKHTNRHIQKKPILTFAYITGFAMYVFHCVRRTIFFFSLYFSKTPILPAPSYIRDIGYIPL